MIAPHAMNLVAICVAIGFRYFTLTEGMSVIILNFLSILCEISIFLFDVV